jgi:type II secretory pathway component HofQ
MQEDRQEPVDVPLLIGLEEALQQTGGTPEPVLEFTTHQSKTQTPTSYQEILITLRCQRADLKEVLQRFVEIGGLNLVIHPGVSGTITTRLERVTWKEALDAIVAMNELSYALEGTVLRVFR